MQLALNIENFSKPVVYESRKANFVFSIPGFLLNFLNSILTKIKTRLMNDLDSFILVLEGFEPHIETLSIEIAIKELQDSKEVLKEFVKLNEKFKKIEYFDDEKIKEKYLYTLKLLYQTESKLHRVVYRSKPIEKTSNELTDGVMKMNSNYINDLLSS